jgi:hypothetical protein
MSDEKPEDKEQVEKAEWDKERQRADEEHANYEKAEEAKLKAIAENEVLAEQYSATQAELAELREKLAAQSEKKDEVELDPDLVDKNVIKEITKLKTAEAKMAKALEEQASKIAEYEKKEQAKEAEARFEGVINKVCTPLDEQFGAKFRIKSGDESEPQDAFDAYLLMEKCYNKVSVKDESKDTETDDGKGGAPPPPETRKTGTMEEVLADMKKDKSWKETSEDTMFI